MRIQIAVPEAHVTKPVLDGALEAVTRLNEELIRKGVSPTDLQLLDRGAVWKPEPPGDEHFDHGATLASRGWGDCDDWAPLRAARLRATGEDPGAIAEVRKSGPKRWHATVTRSDGSEDDPSLDAGMPGPARIIGVRGAWLPVMRSAVHGVDGAYIAMPHLALRPLADRHGQIESWQARADLPWHSYPDNSPSDVAMVTLHQSPVADQAICGAVRGAFRLGESSGFAHEDHLARMAAIADACNGATWEDLAEVYGPEHANAVGGIIEGFFGKALKGLGKLAKGGLKFVTKNPLGKLAMSAIPGASLATQAFNMASPLLKGNVVKAQHLPPGPQRDQALAQPIAVPARTPEGSSRNANGDLNVVLLTRFGDLLAKAYETNRATAPRAAAALRPRPVPRAPVARRAAAPARPNHSPGTAWPPRR